VIDAGDGTAGYKEESVLMYVSDGWKVLIVMKVK
jgi:hypothetical protein